MNSFTNKLKLSLAIIVLIVACLTTPCLADSSCKSNDTANPQIDPNEVRVVYNMSKIENATHIGTVESTLWPGFTETGFGDILAVETLKEQSAAKGADLLVVQLTTDPYPLVGEMYKLNAE